MIHVYTGNGKGKTTSACGLALRAAGRGKRVLFVQFLKGQNSSGEILLMRRIGRIQTRRFGRKGFVLKDRKCVKDFLEAERGIKFAERKLENKDADVIVLDEINVAMSYGLIDTKRVLRLIKRYGRRKEIILTGREVPKSILKKADYVTSMRAIKHPYERGIRARRGIEY